MPPASFWPVSIPMTRTRAGPAAISRVRICPGLAPVACATAGPSTTGGMALARVALALAAYNVGSLIPEAGQLRLPDVAFALAVLQALPLTWRRRWPVAI